MSSVAIYSLFLHISLEMREKKQQSSEWKTQRIHLVNKKSPIWWLVGVTELMKRKLVTYQVKFCFAWDMAKNPNYKSIILRRCVWPTFNFQWRIFPPQHKAAKITISILINQLHSFLYFICTQEINWIFRECINFFNFPYFSPSFRKINFYFTIFSITLYL